MKIRTRFAPSPTGYLHVGSLRTALYSFLFAKHNQGEFLLRIEDTDQSRFVAGAEDELKKTLKDMGIGWDGKAMRQSERLKLYETAAKELVKNNKAYYCFCTEERLKDLRKRQEENKMPTGYDGLCRNITPEEAETRKEHEHSVIRLKMPKRGICKFHDAIRGGVEFSSEREEDAVLLKSDGFPTYHLAYVIDDHEMKITHVIRGEEWLPSVPKHVALWQAFGWEMPVHAHLSLIVNADKTKLSKRQGDVSVESYLEKGYLKEAILNFLLLLGWNPGTEKEIFSLEEMVQAFALEKINKSPAVFNIEKLDWMNGVYIRGLSVSALTERALPFLKNSKLFGEEMSQRELLEKAISLEQPRLRRLSELSELISGYFQEKDYPASILLWKSQTRDAAKMHLQKLHALLELLKEKDVTKENVEKIIFGYIQKYALSNGEVLWPLRAALSGREKSPGPFELVWALGKRETLRRIEKAVQKLAS